MVATVGKGTFGEVTWGWRRSTGEMVAIKILKNKGHHGLTAKNELRLLEALREVDTEESHIVHFLQSFSDGVCTYLVLELLDQNLFEFQKQNFLLLPVRHIRTITAQVLAALVKLKELSIIHADLKPENIMLVDHKRYPFRIKLIDFGSARIFTDIHQIKDPYIQTRFYRAPEILLGLPFWGKMDMWSLGCVMAELHLGRPLFPGINEYDQVVHICSTLGLPQDQLLHAAKKTLSLFQWVPYPTGSWQLRPPGKDMGKPKGWKKYVLSSLNQLAEVNVHPVATSSQEVQAECCDLHGMVELLKRVLTWDSRKRITPNAALKHPFISLQQVKASFEATRYYQLCQEDLRATKKDTGAVEVFHGKELPSLNQTDGFNHAKGDKNQDVHQAPIPTFYSHQHHQWARMEPAAGNWILVRSTNGQKTGHHGGTMGFSGIEEKNQCGQPDT
ncbi:homeodomain-interacting protein kinase 4-like [Cuculus canorus]|uniref:homeodomain-interacting protein kinase 4-like n=1 Tax=Cuculus canorus TaxID=55661 RepID=UPI0023AA9DAE|nr:homeodomain-interacting protein kinase 4-like [Cuculus canorus]